MPMPKKGGYTWPFKWNGRTKVIRDKMLFWVENTDDSKAIMLTKNDYEELIKSLPKDYPPLGTPKFEGRDIFKMGVKK